MVIRLDARLGPSALIFDPVMVTVEDHGYPNPFSQYPAGIMTIKAREGDELLVGFAGKWMATDMLDELYKKMHESGCCEIPCERWIYSGEATNERTEED